MMKRLFLLGSALLILCISTSFGDEIRDDLDACETHLANLDNSTIASEMKCNMITMFENCIAETFTNNSFFNSTLSEEYAKRITDMTDNHGCIDNEGGNGDEENNDPIGPASIKTQDGNILIHTSMPNKDVVVSRVTDMGIDSASFWNIRDRVDQAEQVLQTKAANLDLEMLGSTVQSLSNDVETEFQSVRNEFSIEVQRVTDNMDILSSDISTDMSRDRTDLSNEIITQSTDVSSDLSNLDTSISTTIHQIENELTNEINDVKDSVTNLSTDQASALNTAIGGLGTTLQNNINSVNSRVTQTKNELIASRNTLSTSIRADIIDESNARSTQDSNLNTKITNERNRAVGIENKISTDLSTEVRRATDKENSIQGTANTAKSNADSANSKIGQIHSCANSGLLRTAGGCTDAVARIIHDGNSGSCNAGIRGKTRYNRNSRRFQVCEGSWLDIDDTSLYPGSSSSRRVNSCLDTNLNDQLVWINNIGTPVYCHNGWALVARVKSVNCLDHYNNNDVRNWLFPVVPETSETSKWRDAWINQYRAQSPYSGSTGFWLQAHFHNDCKDKHMFCDKACVFNARNPVRNGPCARCTLEFEGGFTQLHPNDGTRGLGHHHYNWLWFGWVRHPEQGCGNPGIRSDACGHGDGYLWVR